MLTSTSSADFVFAVHTAFPGLQRVEVDDHKTAPGVVRLGSVRIHYWGSVDIDDVRDAVLEAAPAGVVIEIAKYDPVPPCEQWALMIDGGEVHYTSWDLSRIGLLSHLGEAAMVPWEYRTIELEPGKPPMVSAAAEITGRLGTTMPIVHRWFTKGEP
jgi:hypothetical protein